MINEADMHPLAWQYLEQLRGASLALPRSRRSELIADIETHLTESTSPTMSNAEVLNVIDKLGDPEDIVASAVEPGDTTTAAGMRSDLDVSGQTVGTREWITIALLLAGGFVGGFGWIVGAVMLWTSNVWNRRDKWIGTLLFPGGLVFSLLAVLVVFGTNGTGVVSHKVSVVAVRISPNGAVTTSGFNSGGSSVATSTSTTSAGHAALLVILAILLVAVPTITAVRLARHAAPARRYR